MVFDGIYQYVHTRDSEFSQHANNFCHPKQERRENNFKKERIPLQKSRAAIPFIKAEPGVGETLL